MKNLHLEGFPELFQLPTWIEGATDTLETLMVGYRPNLKMLHNFLINMLHLKRLYIYNCPLLNRILLPIDMPLLIGLEDLRIDGCPGLYRKYHPQCGEHWCRIGLQYLESKAFSLETQKEKHNEVIDFLEGKISLPPRTSVFIGIFL